LVIAESGKITINIAIMSLLVIGLVKQLKPPKKEKGKGKRKEGSLRGDAFLTLTLASHTPKTLTSNPE